MRTARELLVSLALADHMGDVNNDLPELARLLGESEPEWDDHKRRYVFPWEEEEEE